jgi:hypothetical protein
LYRKYNDEFDKENRYGELIRHGVSSFVDRPELHVDPFLRSHVFQSIVLALIEFKNKIGLEERALEIAPDTRVPHFKESVDQLQWALDEPEQEYLPEFVDACTSKTNVNRPRAIRFLYFLRAFRNA